MKILTIKFLLLTVAFHMNPVIFDFSKSNGTENWVIVDDGVMGGLSKGSMKLNDQGHAEFSGYVTTENNGGFSSVRYNFETKNVSEFTHVVLKVKGDGKDFQFRIKKFRYDRASFINTFETSGEWQTLKIALADFYPSFRGYKLNKPNFDGSIMEEITFLIANKKNEYFKLLIDSVYLE